MPRPPSVDSWPEMKFIARYFLQGCAVPYSLIAEFSKEPAGDLFLLLFSFDLEDIVKDWLRPGGGRARDPGRHGKKNRRKGFSFDPNHYVGARARAKAGPYPGIKLPGARAIFAIDDVAQGVAITAAIVEGLTDIGFETLWGILSFNPNQCPGLPYVMRSQTGQGSMPGVAPNTAPLVANVLNAAQLFPGDGPFAYTTYQGNFTIASKATLQGLVGFQTQNLCLTVNSLQRGIIAESYAADLDGNESVDLAVEAEAEPGEFVAITRDCDFGTITYRNLTVLGFAEKKWL